MTTYFPPVENVPIFDPYLFSSTNEYNPLTVVEANRLYLTYPLAQKTETFPANIILNGDNTNYIQFPDGTKQFKSSSIGSFQPLFVNYTGVGTNDLFGPQVKFSGTWGIKDFAIIRVTHQINWVNNSGWNYYGSTRGILIIRPYYFGGNWTEYYTMNSGSGNSGPTKKAYYYSCQVNTNAGKNYSFGSYSNFLLNHYISGTDNIISFNSNDNTSDTAELGATIQLEYMSRSVNGGSVSFLNGTGTNNTLP